MDVMDIVMILIFIGWLVCMQLTVISIDKRIEEVIKTLNELVREISRVQHSIRFLENQPKIRQH